MDDLFVYDVISDPGRGHVTEYGYKYIHMTPRAQLLLFPNPFPFIAVRPHHVVLRTDIICVHIIICIHITHRGTWCINKKCFIRVPVDNIIRDVTRIVKIFAVGQRFNSLHDIILLLNYYYNLYFVQRAAVRCLRVCDRGGDDCAFSRQHPQRRISHANNAFCKNPTDQNKLYTYVPASTHTHTRTHKLAPICTKYHS